MAFLLAKGIEVEILFVRNEQKDCNVKPDPQGFAQIKNRPIKKLKVTTILSAFLIFKIERKLEIY